MDYVVYQHRNVQRNEVFYIGCGLKKRAHQFGECQRSLAWNKYIENNKLKSPVELNQPNIYRMHLMSKEVKVEILEYFEDFDSAHKRELELINKLFGTVGYPLVNNNFTDKMTKKALKARGKIISDIRSVAIINLITKIEYKGATEAARLLSIGRDLIVKQCLKNHTRLLENQPLISTQNGSFIYSKDKILLKS